LRSPGFASGHYFFYSPTIKMVGGVILKLIGRGIYVVLKSQAIAVIQLIHLAIGACRQSARLNAA
jgi:hypothetical protein